MKLKYGLMIFLVITSIVYASPDIVFQDGKLTTSGLDVDSNTLYVDDVNDRVGIGTSNPSEKLVVSSEGTTERSQIRLISGEGSDAQFYLVSDDGDDLALGDWWRTYVSGTSSDFNIEQFIDSSWTNRITIENGTGFVGIGTSTPSSKLAVDNGHITIGANYFLRMAGNDDNWKIGVNSGVTPARIEIGAYGGDTRQVSIGGYTSGVFSPKLTVNSDSGNVGVGTTTPSFKLEVRNDNYNAIRAIGNSSNSVGIYIKNEYSPEGEWGITSQGDGDLVVYDQNDGAERITIKGNGNIGIGTTDPQTKLGFGNINGNKINLRETGNNYKFLISLASNVAEVITRFGAPSAYNGPIFQWGEISTGDGSSFSSFMTLDGYGRLGIGTANPIAKLDIHSNVPLHFNDTSSGNPDNSRIRVGMENGNLFFQALNGVGSGGGNTIQINRSGTSISGMTFTYNGRGNTIIGTTNSYFGLINGNVGIGTSTPNQKLHVAGNANVTGTLYYGALQANSPHLFAEDHDVGYTRILVKAKDGSWLMRYWDYDPSTGTYKEYVEPVDNDPKKYDKAIQKINMFSTREIKAEPKINYGYGYEN